MSTEHEVSRKSRTLPDATPSLDGMRAALGKKRKPPRPQAPRPNTKILTPAEVAYVLGCSVPTLAYWRIAGKGPAFVRPKPRMVRYRLEDLEAFLGAPVRSTTEADARDAAAVGVQATPRGAVSSLDQCVPLNQVSQHSHGESTQVEASTVPALARRADVVARYRETREFGGRGWSEDDERDAALLARWFAGELPDDVISVKRATVLRLRYDPEQPKKLREIASILGVSSSRAAQLIDNAFMCLRRAERHL